MKRHTQYRTLYTSQRYGTDLEEITLQFDENSRRLSAGVARADADIAEAMTAVLDFLKTQSEPVEWKVIDDAVEGRKQMKLQALKKCIGSGTTIRNGNGKKGDPYLYSLSGSAGSAYKAGTTEPQSLNLRNQTANAGSRVPGYIWEPENPGNHNPEGKL